MAERTNEERLDLLADMMDSTAEIFNDPEIQALAEKDAPPIKYVKPAIKNHKAACIAVLAALEETPADEYRVPAPGAFFMKVLGLFTRPEVQALFTLQGQKSGNAFSGSAMGNTEASAT